MASPKSTRSEDTQYSTMNLKGIINDLEDHMWRHAGITWILIPVFGALQAFIPFLQPTCESGFADITLIAVVLYEAHHMFSESRAWALIKQMLAPPEITILRHLGVLKKRKAYFWLGFIESLDLYTDVTFPFVARSCDAHLTARWSATWEIVPGVGPIMVGMLKTIRFWGFCLLLNVIVIVISGWLGLVFMRNKRQQTAAKHEADRIGGEIFFNFAQSAETAMMPSVAMIAEEIANERKYKYDVEKDNTAAMQERLKLSYGQTTERQVLELEMRDLREEENIAHAAKSHYILLMVVKVLVGNCMQLWLHSSFYAVTYEITGQEAKIKIIISMICSTVQGLIRCKLILPKLGALGAVLSLMALFVIGWSGAKVYFTYKCDSHLWNLTSGCVMIKE